MSSAAQRNEVVDGMEYLSTGTDGMALQQIAAERLAAHRNRRAEAQAQEAELKALVQSRNQNARGESLRGASKVREAVAARYEQSVSYREFLAAEAERAIAQAQAEAEVATRNAKAVAEAQTQLIQELEQWRQEGPGPRAVAMAAAQAEVRGELAHELADIALAARELMSAPPLLTVMESSPALKVRMYEGLETSGPLLAKNRMAKGSLARDNGVVTPHDENELEHLEQEIEFRLAPSFNDHIVETTPIPANILQFPRQLIASRKARPRREEGPLREESGAEPQLRIFEVEAEQISATPAETTAAPEWQGLPLPSSVESRPAAGFNPELQLTSVPETAPLELRLMAAAVDACCLGVAFVSFVAAAFAVSGHTLKVVALPTLAGTAGAALFVMFVAYKMLFFTLSEATPGMRVARIGLCTFADSNPTRKAMRRRMASSLIAACPVGLGLLWMALDDDRLGWHDRMSRMYPRAY